MSKCEWKEFLLTEDDWEWETETIPNGMLVKYRRKPEPEVIIRKSGETWVALINGEHRFCLSPWDYSDNCLKADKATKAINGSIDDWPLISEIEITDEIAKLRPMVVAKNKYGCCEKINILVHVKNNATLGTGIYVVVPKYGPVGSMQICRLATVSDLE